MEKKTRIKKSGLTTTTKVSERAGLIAARRGRRKEKDKAKDQELVSSLSVWWTMIVLPSMEALLHLVLWPFFSFWGVYVCNGLFLERMQKTRPPPPPQSAQRAARQTWGRWNEKPKELLQTGASFGVWTPGDEAPNTAGTTKEPSRVRNNDNKNSTTAAAHRFSQIAGVLCQNMLASLVFGAACWTFVGQFYDIEAQSQQAAEPFLELATKGGAAFVFADFWFYHSHRAFHEIPRLYVLHLKHHTFRFPTALSAVYCDWREMIAVNLITALSGPIFLRMSPCALHIWLVGACVYTQLEHHGSQLVAGINPEHHDQHHQRVKGNYGLTRFWDCVHGTCLDFSANRNAAPAPAPAPALVLN